VTVPSAVRVAVRVLAERFAAGDRSWVDERAGKVLAAELLAAGCWTPVQSARIDGLRTDRIAADLVRRMAATEGRGSGFRHQLMQYLDSVINPPVSSIYRTRIDAGLALLAELVDQAPEQEPR
jgi:hypothetical protein